MLGARDCKHSCSCLVLLASLLAACSNDEIEPLAPTVPVPFTATGDFLTVWRDGEYQPLFVKGINLGVAVPGTQPGELAATSAQYKRWLSQVAALGFNTLRSYTLHYPRFYEALWDYNRAHADAPLYLLGGIWLEEENPSGDLFALTETFDEALREAVDCVHGNCTISSRLGRAYGDFRADISRWVSGWIIGREIAPAEVAKTNRAHPERTSYSGEALSLPSGSPTEVWLVERLDTLIRYERENYGVERPVSFSSWPTLDPLHHPSEAKESSEDSEKIDLANVDTSRAPAGYFASYHAYPYYPDFMTRDPAYAEALDRVGPNSYQGYLHALRQHYSKHPLLIAEFGVPTSWGNAHYGAAGMNHGGQTEREQGEQAARLMTNIADARCAGGAFFALLDEWWKRTWIVDKLAFPRVRYRLWHNVTSPEQNFGLIAFELDPPRFKRWPPVRARGRIRSVERDVDAEFFHVRLTLDSPLREADTLTVGFDTYGDAVGESRLPSGAATGRRHEFALVLTPPDAAQLYVTEAYDLFGIWHDSSAPTQLYHSIASDGGRWVPVRWKNNRSELEAESDPASNVDEIGRLRVRRNDGSRSTREAVILDGAAVHLRIPWTLLQFGDPTTRTVLDDQRSTPDRETAVSEGIGLTVQLGDELLDIPRVVWERWDDAPPTRERLKESAEVLARTLRAL